MMLSRARLTKTFVTTSPGGHCWPFQQLSSNHFKFIADYVNSKQRAFILGAECIDWVFSALP